MSDKLDTVGYDKEGVEITMVQDIGKDNLTSVMDHEVKLYDKYGALKLIPTPSCDPNGNLLSVISPYSIAHLLLQIH